MCLICKHVFEKIQNKKSQQNCLLRLEPLLARIKEDRRAVLCPEIDLIDSHTIGYHGSGSYSVGGFWWSLHFSWRPIPQREKDRRRHSTDPMR